MGYHANYFNYYGYSSAPTPKPDPLYLHSVCYELDGEEQELNVPLSATSCRALAERIMAENEECTEVRVVNLLTGEIVYSIKRTIRIEVDYEVYDNIDED